MWRGDGGARNRRGAVDRGGFRRSELEFRLARTEGEPGAGDGHAGAAGCRPAVGAEVGDRGPRAREEDVGGWTPEFVVGALRRCREYERGCEATRDRSDPLVVADKTSLDVSARRSRGAQAE